MIKMISITLLKKENVPTIHHTKTTVTDSTGNIIKETHTSLNGVTVTYVKRPKSQRQQASGPIEIKEDEIPPPSSPVISPSTSTSSLNLEAFN